MTHGHGQWGGDGLWEQGMGWDKGRPRGKNWDNCNRKFKKHKKKKMNQLHGVYNE